MNNFNMNLEKYAELAVKQGVNLKDGDGLFVRTNSNNLPLARLILKKAYQQGAKHVEIAVSDDEMTLLRYENGKKTIFEEFPKWRVTSMEAMLEEGYKWLNIISPNPELLKDVDSEILSVDNKTGSMAFSGLMKFIMSGKTRTCIVAAASEAWAKIVFPDLEIGQAMASLWEQIFKITRIDQEDPVAAWQTHDDNLKKYVNYLNEKNFDTLIYKGPGTDLEVGLAKDHLWVGGSKKDITGTPYIANIPTEEVFTTPHKLKVNGTLKSTMPLSLRGKLVEGFGFTFKEGKVVDYYAEKGKEVLDALLANDEGAKYLGEVALVPDDSPISNSGLVFSNTLFDENASCHFALGRAYSYAMKDGTKIDPEDLYEKGANNSLIHVDFMVGSDQLNIWGRKDDGTEIQLFKDGNWLV